MDIEKMTVRVQKSLNDAYSIAVKNHNQQLDVIHLFSALVNQEDGLIPNIFDKMNVSVDALKSSIDLELKKLPQIHGEGISSQGVTATRRINEVLIKSSKNSLLLLQVVRWIVKETYTAAVGGERSVSPADMRFNHSRDHPGESDSVNTDCELKQWTQWKLWDESPAAFFRIKALDGSYESAEGTE